MPVKKSAKGVPSPTVTLKHLAAKLADDHSVPKKQAETILTDLVGLLTKHLKKGDRIRIVGLGILQVRKRAARMGRNPATGEAIKIKASKSLSMWCFSGAHRPHRCRDTWQGGASQRWSALPAGYAVCRQSGYVGAAALQARKCLRQAHRGLTSS
jgi:DNA-binding protein HU-beta